MRLSRLALFVFLTLIATSAFAAADMFLQIPGVNGPSNRKGRAGWSDVQQLSLNLLPAVQDANKKNVLVSQCTAVVIANLGAGAAKTAELVGTPLTSDVVVEAENPVSGQTFYRAALKGAVIAADSSSELGRDALSISFTKIVLTISPQKADGTLDAPQTGILDCLKP